MASTSGGTSRPAQQPTALPPWRELTTGEIYAVVCKIAATFHSVHGTDKMPTKTRQLRDWLKQILVDAHADPRIWKQILLFAGLDGVFPGFDKLPGHLPSVDEDAEYYRSLPAATRQHVDYNNEICYT